MNNRNRIIMFVIIGLAAILFVFLLLRVSSSKDNDSEVSIHESVPGKIDLDLFFDETAPIQIKSGDRYGFANADGSSWLIRPIYVSVERYYGNYAKVETDTGKYRLLDRSGNIIKEADSYIDINYNLDGNVWIINGVIYDSSLKALSPEDASSSYLGDNYMLISPKEEGKTAYISTLSGEKIYDCGESDCTAMYTKDYTTDKKYIVIYRSSLGLSIMIDLSSGEEVFSSKKGSYLTKYNEGILLERRASDSAILRYVVLSDDKVTTLSSYPSLPGKQNDKYYTHLCSNGYYAITANKNASDQETLTDCIYTEIIMLPELVYTYFENKGQEPVLLISDTSKETENAVKLYDLKTGKVIRTFSSIGVTVYNESPFIHLYSNTGTEKICSLFKDQCFDIQESSIVEAFNNYFTINGRMYTNNYTEIKL